MMRSQQNFYQTRLIEANEIQVKSKDDNKTSKIVETTTITTSSKNIETLIKLIIDKITQLRLLKFRSAVIKSPDFLNSLAFYC